MAGRESRFTLRLYDAESDVEDGAALEGVTRSEFLRRAARQRRRMLERDLEEETITTDEEEEGHAE